MDAPAEGSLPNLVIWCIAIENGPFIVDIPIKHGDFPIFSIVMSIYQRVQSDCLDGEKFVTTHLNEDHS